jgi:tetratricopeptide (TPR) repeat protein/tRNA A-37 threonylcarbamoyl transferase component Bud32
VGRPATPAAPPAGVPPELASHPKFRIVRELGKGGMGVIYLAEHRVLDKPVALKVINPTLLDNPDTLARFHVEARAAAKLDHQNIARAYDADRAGDLHFLVLEFVEGVSLAHLVEKKGPLSVTAACHCVSQVAMALQHAYEQGMVHRDIKPHNLMLTPRGQVKVLDFGLARLRSERQASARLTQLDSFMGTPEYVSPEQAEDARKADTRSDIYSLGCTLYALLTGQPPFAEGTATQIVLAHIEKDPVPVHEVRPDVPAEVSAVVARMLAKDPKQRYQQPVEVVRALAPFIKAEGRPAAAGAAALPPARAASTGTVVGSDTNKGEKVGQEASRRPAKGTAAAHALRKSVDREQEAVGPAQWWKRPGVLAIAAVGTLVLLAGIIVAVTTSDGSTLVVEVNEPNPEILVNGEKITVTWKGGGMRAEISRVSDRAEVTVRKDGFEVIGRKPEVKDGKRVLRVTLVPKPPLLGPGKKAEKPPPPGDGSVSLFNGKDLQGWKVFPQGVGNWTVKDGILTCSGGFSILYSEGDDYENFHLFVEAKINQGGNSGLFFWSACAPGPNGCEAEIILSPELPKTGTLYETSPKGFRTLEVVNRNLIAPNEWFTQEVIALGDQVRILVNGKEVVNKDLGESRPYGRHFGLQHYSQQTQVEFRQIKVEKLPAPKPRSAAKEHFSRGEALAYNGRHKEAEAEFSEAVRLQPDFALAHFNLGNALFWQGRHKEAEEAFRAAIRLQPDDAEVRRCLGRALNYQGRHKEAEEAFRAAIRLQPDSAWAHNGLGYALWSQGKHKEAETEYRAAIRLQPDNAVIHNNLGWSLNGQDRYKEAEEAFREALRLNPDTARAHHGLGISFNNQSRYEEALKEFRAAVRLEPGNEGARKDLNDLLRRLGRPQ